jgi:hypothetical protein
MRVAVMQPYLFPYLGYFQLLAACDAFVAFDDVQYIRRGWVNRNRIAVAGAPAWVSLPVTAAPRDAAIAQCSYAAHDRRFGQFLRQVAAAYRAAPYRERVLELLEEAFAFGDLNVARFNVNALRVVSSHLGVDTPVHVASGFGNACGLRGEARILDICTHLRATEYVNPIGGTALYDAAHFASCGIGLRFLQPHLRAYSRGAGEPLAGLSVIDVLMFNEVAAVRAMLADYSLVSAADVAAASG